MTRREIMIRILSEVSGKPEAEMAEVVKLTENLTANSKRNLDTELPETEGQVLMTKLRANKAGILKWLQDGARQAEAMMPWTDRTQ